MNTKPDETQMHFFTEITKASEDLDKARTVTSLMLQAIDSDAGIDEEKTRWSLVLVKDLLDDVAPVLEALIQKEIRNESEE